MKITFGYKMGAGRTRLCHASYRNMMVATLQEFYEQLDILVSNINDKSLPVEYYDTFVTVGGVGRMTRFITMGFGIRVPIENLFHMRYSSIEITMGTSF